MYKSTNNRPVCRAVTRTAVMLLTWLAVQAAAAESAKPETLPLARFVKLACRRDTSFQKILIDQLYVKYKTALELPARDLVLSARGRYQVALTPNVSQGVTGNVSLSKLFPETGSEVTAGGGASLTGGGLRPDLSFTFSQDIAQNAFGQNARLQRRITETQKRIIEHQIVEAYEDYLASLIKVYYDWFSAYTNLQATRNVYRDSQKLLREVRDKQRRHIARPVDVDKVRLQTLSRRETLINHRNAWKKYSRTVHSAVGEKTAGRFTPASPTLYRAEKLSLTGSAAKLFAGSRTYRVLSLTEKKADLYTQKVIDDLLPSARLQTGYEYDGADTEPVQRLFAGISLDMSIPNEKKRAAAETARLDRKKSALSTAARKTELRRTLINLQADMAREKALSKIAEQKSALSRKVAASEKRDYNFGRASLNNLIQAVNDAEDNRTQAVNHAMRYNILSVEWLRLTDRLVERRQVLEGETPGR